MNDMGLIELEVWIYLARQAICFTEHFFCANSFWIHSQSLMDSTLTP